MKLGTIIQLPDGRIGTVVYHHLDGYGIVWGVRDLAEAKASEEYKSTGFSKLIPEPEAMLRSLTLDGKLSWPCVGEEYEVVE